jgi:(E)-4-hydroxy-3-methylbut-2-enyl-diphosphate synthase
LFHQFVCTVPTQEAADAIREIKRYIHIPLVADIHFDYRMAIAAIENGADKIRINPGNIGSTDRIKAVVDAAKERNIPIRVGVNSGSLEKDLIEKYNGVTAEGLVESALDKVKIIENPTDVNINSCIIFSNGKQLFKISKILDFKSHLKVFFEDGSYRLYDKKHIKIEKNSLNNNRVNSVLEYLKSLAEKIKNSIK